MTEPYTVPEAVIDAHRGAWISDVPGQFEHRGMVLRVACELEEALASLLIARLRSINPALHEPRAEKDLFGETGLLSSLTKMSRLAIHLGLLTDDEVHDIRITANLRNKYAHGLRRGQFYQDAEMKELVRSFRLFQNSTAKFSDAHDHCVFLSCQEALRRRLFNRAMSFAEHPAP